MAEFTVRVSVAWWLKPTLWLLELVDVLPRVGPRIKFPIRRLIGWGVRVNGKRLR